MQYQYTHFPALFTRWYVFPQAAHRIFLWKQSVTVAMCLGGSRCRFFQVFVSPPASRNSRSPLSMTVMPRTAFSNTAPSNSSIPSVRAEIPFNSSSLKFTLVQLMPVSFLERHIQCK